MIGQVNINSRRVPHMSINAKLATVSPKLALFLLLTTNTFKFKSSNFQQFRKLITILF